jgi:hypothetical protein
LFSRIRFLNFEITNPVRHPDRIIPQEFKKKLNFAVFTRVADPDPHGFAFIRVAGSESGSRTGGQK